ncbi:CBM_collapsed_G0025660.mRNA.1.CDS.1 [Saccharomyces cerevisiae]|nr:CBM_collapsed_G0025660.mRNA.1.CDS.1 [Saccharomyces cerevisiae]
MKVMSANANVVAANNEQCQNHLAAQRGATATTNAPAVTSLKKPRSHAALGNETNSL